MECSEAVARSALVREESRGAHSRLDFPDLSADWGTRNNIIRRDREGMSLRQEGKLELPPELREILAEDK